MRNSPKGIMIFSEEPGSNPRYYVWFFSIPKHRRLKVLSGMWHLGNCLSHRRHTVVVWRELQSRTQTRAPLFRGLLNGASSEALRLWLSTFPKLAILAFCPSLPGPQPGKSFLFRAPQHQDNWFPPSVLVSMACHLPESRRVLGLVFPVTGTLEALEKGWLGKPWTE